MPSQHAMNTQHNTATYHSVIYGVKKMKNKNYLSKMYACIQLKNIMSTSKIEITLFYVTSDDNNYDCIILLDSGAFL